MTFSRHRLLTAAILITALIWCGGVSAQPAGPQPPEPGDLRPAEIQRLFDAYFVMEAQQALGLTDAQYAPFLTRLRALQETRRRYLASRAALLLDLGRLDRKSVV